MLRFLDKKIIYNKSIKDVTNNWKRKKIERKIQYDKPLFLDLGCGSLKRKGFIGIDLSPNADIRWDLRLGIPCKDNSVSVIRSDHFFEHLDINDLIKMFQECKRVLIPGGILDFTVPHINPYLSAYLENDFNFLKEKISDIPDGSEELYNTCFDRIMWLLYRSGEHKTMFDSRSIIEKLRVSGFNSVTTRKYDPNKDTDPRFSSIYVVAIK